MAECNTCGGYLSIEDKIRLSMKCDANGNVVWRGALLNQNEPPENALKFEGTEEYIFFEGDETEQYITFETIE